MTPRAVALLGLLVAFGGAGVAHAAPALPLCAFQIVLLDAEARGVEAAVTCREPVLGFRFADEFPADWVVSFADAAGQPLERAGVLWRPRSGAIGTARYRLDLDGMARTQDDYDSAKRSGRSVMVDLSGLVPVPIVDGGVANEAGLALSFSTPAGGAVASSLPQVEGAYHVLGREVDFATALVLGTFERRPIRVPMPLSLGADESAAAAKDPQGVIDLVVMDGPLRAGTDEIEDWVRASALVNADLWRGFPVARSMVVILPTPGRSDLPFGRVISIGGVVVLVLVGSEIEPRALYDEWILVHEFIHLGTPFIRDTGAWLNEGIATYLEPIIRYRAGWRSAESVWEEWLGWMGRGVPPMSRGLSSGSPYWGGALYSLMADIELRQLTEGRLGFEDSLRTILAEMGDIAVIGRTRPALALADRGNPEPVLTRLAEIHLDGAPVDLDALFAMLGVRNAGGSIEFDDEAPMAEVRRWLLDGGPDPRLRPIPIPADQ